MNSGDKLLTASGTKSRQAGKASRKSHEERKELPLSEHGARPGALLPAPHGPLLAQGRWGGQEKQAPRAAEERLRGATPAGRTDTAGLRVRKALRSPSIAAGLSIKQENTKMLRGLLPGSLP